jgi:hypothetical protein
MYNSSRAQISEQNLIEVNFQGNGCAHGTNLSPSSSFADLEGEEMTDCRYYYQCKHRYQWIYFVHPVGYQSGGQEWDGLSSDRVEGAPKCLFSINKLFAK